MGSFACKQHSALWHPSDEANDLQHTVACEAVYLNLTQTLIQKRFFVQKDNLLDM
jgi:hypothetical protein